VFEFEEKLMKKFSSLAERLRSHFLFEKFFWQSMETSVFEDAEVSGMVDLGKTSVVAFSIGRSCREIFWIENFVDIRARKIFLSAKSFAADVIICIWTEDHEMRFFDELWMKMSDLGRETWRGSYLKHGKGVAGGAGEFQAENQFKIMGH
jgi:hypothetical protein